MIQTLQLSVHMNKYDFLRWLSDNTLKGDVALVGCLAFGKTGENIAG